MRVNWANALKAGDAKVVLQVAMKKIPDLSGVPAAMDLAKSDEARQLIKSGAIDPAAIVRVYVTSPRTPKDRVETLRKAFAATLADPEFLAETKKINLDVNPLSGEEVKKIVDDLFKLPPPMVKRLAAILAGK